MSIKIKNIKVKNLGPLPPLKHDLGQLNLVYGDNEAGKSYLVEFLIHSLFKPQKWSNIRDNLGAGKVIVNGLVKKDLEFSPDKKIKLADQLSQKQEYIGLPPDFSKLLVVRPADIELGRDRESDKLMLRRFLSHKEILDQIEDNIEQKTIKKCKISGYQIEGVNKGKISDRQDLKNKLEKIDSLFEEVEEKYFGGELFQLKEQKQKLEQKQKQLDQAKRHQAFKLAQEKQKLEQKANQINEQIIDQLMTQFNGLKRDQVKISQQIKELQDLNQEVSHYHWLTKAIEIYQDHNLDTVTDQPQLLVLVGLAGAFLLTATLLLLGITIGAVISLLVTGLIVIFLIRMKNQSLNQFGREKELKKLKNGFQSKFSHQLNSLADLKAEREKVADKYHKQGVLEDKVSDSQTSLRSEKAVLMTKVANLLDQEVDFDQIQKVLKGEKQKKRDLETKINQKNQRLAALGVKEEDYLAQELELDYDQDKEGELKSQIAELDQEIQTKESQIETLKHQILSQVDASGSEEITDLVDPLAQKRHQILDEYKQLTAEIIAKKNVYQVVKELYQAEDEKIDRVLNSNLIKQLLPQITTRYKQIYLEDQSLMVEDDYDSFPVSQLSSGAKEQVFLALRIALASEWFKKEKMFLILDDAFIHSDRHRKAELVKSVIDLSQTGWQIICFSFDERIKNLFDRASGKYNLLNLNKL